jgi:hypothetical protein
MAKRWPVGLSTLTALTLAANTAFDEIVHIRNKMNSVTNTLVVAAVVVAADKIRFSIFAGDVCNVTVASCRCILIGIFSFIVLGQGIPRTLKKKLSINFMMA